MATKDNVTAIEQEAEFNKQFDIYNRNNVQGSELLSLVNKVRDYNYKYERDGYEKIQMSVKFTSNITTKDATIISAGSLLDQNGLKDKERTIEDTIRNLKNQTIAGRKIETLSGLWKNQLKDLLGDKYTDDVQDKINNYLSYKSALSILKSKTFKATNFEYSRSNGRISKMSFVEN